MRLFKYVCDDRIDILTNGVIRFTQPSAWNDPFETQPNYIDHRDKNMFFKFAEMVHRAKESGENPTKEEIEEYERERKRITKSDINSYINRNIVGLSLTEDNNNLLMWSHYASNHSGFVIEFDTENDFFQSTDNYLFKVMCDNERPSVNTNDFASIIVDLVELIKKNETISQESYETISYTFRKSLDWLYEREWRLITTVDKAPNFNTIKKELNVIHIGDTAFENQYVALFDFPTSCIKAIYCGKRMKLDKIRELFFLTKYNTRFSHIKLMRAEIDDKFYKMTYSAVTDMQVLKVAELQYEEKSHTEKLRCKFNPYYQRYENEKKRYKKIKPIGAK